MELIVGIIVSIYQVIKISQYDKIKNNKDRCIKIYKYNSMVSKISIYLAIAYCLSAVVLNGGYSFTSWSFYVSLLALITTGYRYSRDIIITEKGLLLNCNLKKWSEIKNIKKTKSKIEFFVFRGDSAEFEIKDTQVKDLRKMYGDIQYHWNLNKVTLAKEVIENPIV